MLTRKIYSFDFFGIFFKNFLIRLPLGILCIKTDPVLDELTRILAILHSNLVNPAFLVQLFARLLHYIGARLFNGLVEEPVRVSPQWGRLLFEWIHKKLAAWAEPQGLRVAVECYLTRLSQVSDLGDKSVKSSLATALLTPQT